MDQPKVVQEVLADLKKFGTGLVPGSRQTLHICAHLLFTFVKGCSAEVSTNSATVRIGSCAKIQTNPIAGNFPYATNKGMAKTAGKAQEKMSREAKHHLYIIIPKL